MRYPMIAATLLFVLAACESDASGPDVSLPNGSMSARIDGALWQATVLVHANRHQNILTVGGGGTMDGKPVAIAITTIGLTGPGTVTFGPGVHSGASVGEAQTASWSARNDQGSGSVTVTFLDDTRVAGTFAFDAVADAASAATGTRKVTEGKFDIRF
jgi:hypothetical protein